MYANHTALMNTRLSLFALLLFAACSPNAETEKQDELPLQPIQTVVFACPPSESSEAIRFMLRTGADENVLTLPASFSPQTIPLMPVRAASGARYAGGEGAGAVDVWNKGQEARLQVGEAVYEGCVMDTDRDAWEAAQRSGINFRGVGQEPGWLLEIDRGDRIRFSYAYGEREAVVPTPEPSVEGGTTTYRAETEAGALVVTITGEACTDAMSGEPYEATVRVELGGETYGGCGSAVR
jgi:uncharacterized membrane protein